MTKLFQKGGHLSDSHGFHVNDDFEGGWLLNDLRAGPIEIPTIGAGLDLPVPTLRQLLVFVA